MHVCHDGSAVLLSLSQVKVLWVVNAVEKTWEKALPDEVGKALTGSRKKKGGLYATGEASKDAEEEDAGKCRWPLQQLPVPAALLCQPTQPPCASQAGRPQFCFGHALLQSWQHRGFEHCV